MPDRIQTVLFLTPFLLPHTDEQDLLLVHPPNMPENPRVLRVVLLGAPNAGKSTLSNQLLGRKVCYILDSLLHLLPPHTYTPPFHLSMYCLKGIWNLTWNFFVPGRCFLSPRRCTLLAAKLWGSSQRMKPRWWVPATRQRMKLRGPPLVLYLKKMMFRLISLRGKSLLFL